MKLVRDKHGKLLPCYEFDEEGPTGHGSWGGAWQDTVAADELSHFENRDDWGHQEGWGSLYD